MSYLTHLKRYNHSKDSRWIVKYNGKLVREVKLIFNPKEYLNINKHNRPLHTKESLIKILENDRINRNSCS
jgi:hypothetical protein